MPPSNLDPTIVDLSKAIRQTESGGNPNAKGASGEYGAYQWEPGTWDAESKAAGVNVPLEQSTLQQQNQVAYNTLSTWKKQHPDWNIGNMASAWNAGEGDPNAYQENHVGTNSQGVSYDTPAYAKKVAEAYQQFKAQRLQQSPTSNLSSASLPPPGGTQQSSGASAPGLPPPPQPPTQDQTQDPSQQGGFVNDLSSGNIGAAATDAVKGIGNFLFPAVGDIYNDITGQNKKTGLQQLGDVGLTALPFIPGLGEAGEAARGAELAGEGAAKVAPGVLSKLAGSTVAKGAAVGYGAGVASNLSQGQGLGQAFMPNAATIGGTVLGGAAPAVLKGLGGIATKISGIDPQIQTKLTQLGLDANPEDATLYDKYMSAAKAHATNGEVEAPQNIAAGNIDQASSEIDKKAIQAGQAVDAANKGAENVPIPQEKIPPLAQAFNQNLDSLGYKVGTQDDGTLALVKTRPSAATLGAQETKRILDVADRINGMGNGGNVRNADDLLSELARKHDFGVTGQDPLEGVFGKFYHAVNETVRPLAPNYAAANDRYGQLASLQKFITTLGGNRLQRGEGLMNKMFGPNPGDSQALFAAIKKETGVDLYKHAVLARHAIMSVGSKADKSALQQIIEGSVGGKAGLINAVGSLAQGAAKRLGANPERIGRNLIRGGSPSRIPGLITKGAARVGAAL